MWNLTPEYLQRLREELSGRRAAIQARYADELKSIEQDLQEIETLERIAYSVAVKHLSELPEPSPPESAPPVEPAKLAEDAQETVAPAFAELKADSGDIVDAAMETEPKGVSRWRRRLDTPSESEPA